VKMVSVSQLKQQSANTYKYTMANDDYKALANELNSGATTTEEQYRQRKGINTEKKAAEPVITASAPNNNLVGQTAQPQATQQAQPAQQQTAINQTSGLPVGQTFRYGMSHAQQNKFVRENETKKARGQKQLTELEFRQQIGMDTSVVGGSYVAPKVTNDSPNAGNTGSQKVASTANTPNEVTKSNPKVDSQAKGVSNTATVVSADQVAAKKAADQAAKEQAQREAAAEAKRAADAKKAAEAEAAAKAKEAARLAAEAKKIADAKARAEAEKAAKAAAKAAEEASKKG